MRGWAKKKRKKEKKMYFEMRRKETSLLLAAISPTRIDAGTTAAHSQRHVMPMFLLQLECLSLSLTLFFFFVHFLALRVHPKVGGWLVSPDCGFAALQGCSRPLSAKKGLKASRVCSLAKHRSDTCAVMKAWTLISRNIKTTDGGVNENGRAFCREKLSQWF